MGFNISWIGVQEPSVDEALGLFGVSAEDKVSSFPDFPMSFCALPNGWSILFFNKGDEFEATLKRCQQHSNARSYLSVSALEGAMTSFAALYDGDGRQIWSLFYPVKAQWRDVVEVGGAPPEGAGDLMMTAYKKQYPGEDNAYDVAYLWDVPIDAAKSVTSFRHDEPKVDGKELVWRKVANAMSGL